MRPLPALPRSAFGAAHPSGLAHALAAAAGEMGCDMRKHQARGSFGRVIVVALLAVMLAGCGDDEKSEAQAAANPSGNPGNTPAPSLR